MSKINSHANNSVSIDQETWRVKSYWRKVIENSIMGAAGLILITILGWIWAVSLKQASNKEELMKQMSSDNKALVEKINSVNKDLVDQIHANNKLIDILIADNKAMFREMAYIERRSRDNERRSEINQFGRMFLQDVLVFAVNSHSGSVPDETFAKYIKTSEKPKEPENIIQRVIKAVKDPESEKITSQENIAQQMVPVDKSEIDDEGYKNSIRRKESYKE